MHLIPTCHIQLTKKNWQFLARGLVDNFYSWRQTRSIPRAPLNATWKYSLILFIFIFYFQYMSCHWHRKTLHCQLRVRRALVQFKYVLLREPEGHYHCTKPMVIAPFCFSMDHRLSAWTPFWLSAKDTFIFISMDIFTKTTRKRTARIYLICYYTTNELDPMKW